MSRRKRASMREGPLADLFRSTVDDGPADPPDEQDTRHMDRPAGASDEVAGQEHELHPRGGASAGGSGREAEQPPVHAEPVPQPDPVPEPTIRRAEPGPEPPPRVDLPPATERLSKIFGEDPNDLDAPRYGRQQPVSHEARPHTPV